MMRPSSAKIGRLCHPGPGRFTLPASGDRLLARATGKDFVMVRTAGFPASLTGTAEAEMKPCVRNFSKSPFNAKRRFELTKQIQYCQRHKE